MDEENVNSQSSRCINSYSCNYMRNRILMQQVASTRTVYKRPNLTVMPSISNNDEFLDCESDCDFPQEGHKSSIKFGDPGAIEVLERAVNATQMLSKIENSDGFSPPCFAMVEITARILTDDNSKETGRRLSGKPVTVTMPLEFNPKNVQKILRAPNKAIPPSLPPKPKICTCRGICKSTNTLFVDCSGDSDMLHIKPSPTHTCNSVDVGKEGLCVCSAPTCLLTCPNKYERHSRDVILIESLPEYELKPEPELELEPELKPELKPKLMPKLEPELDAEAEQFEKLTPEKDISDKISIASTLSSLTPIPEIKRYFMALPQHKEFASCAPCRFDPSPIMDEDGNVFCPGNCGCCQCPWRPRSFDPNHDHVNVKVCKCIKRGTVFANFSERDRACSQTSYFDFCPCREKAEAKFLELYHKEMWAESNITQGREINLNEIKELQEPINRS